MSPRQHSQAPIATSLVEIEAAFRHFCLQPDWRSVAIKRAVQELASTLESVLSIPGRSPFSVDLLVELLPALLQEARRADQFDRLSTAIEQLQLGQLIDLLPLVQAAIADLSARPPERDPS